MSTLLPIEVDINELVNVIFAKKRYIRKLVSQYKMQYKEDISSLQEAELNGLIIINENNISNDGRKTGIKMGIRKKASKAFLKVLKERKNG